jgi:hypothetical protein
MPTYPTRALSTRDQAFVAALRKRPDDPRYARLADKLDPPKSKPKAAEHQPPAQHQVHQPQQPAPPAGPDTKATGHAVGAMTHDDVKGPQPPAPDPKGAGGGGHAVGGATTGDVTPGRAPATAPASPQPKPVPKPQPKGR